ncbi:BrnA antitoxin family protein [Bordetella petrii]|uniref:BrnA antitoxin family protein n=1 Tax=Bordetella petrii TaxID=94624 RepID=UPI001E5D216D|nr:BrnA antitoxin family protein [Bordetella petrii]MCD0501972.1 BrnA antitoxin family protein [Bordetella petrii]
MPKLKPGTILPTPEENEIINRGIKADPDAPEATEADLARARKPGRPPAARTKVQLTVRYDRDVVEAFKAGGPGWQTRMNDVLRNWLRRRA